MSLTAEEKSRSVRALGVEWAPVVIPLERRLQTAAVAMHMMLFFPLSLFTNIIMLYFFVFTTHWWLPLLYLAWVVHDWDVGEKGGRKNKFVRGWRLWRYFRDYFPIRVVRTSPLPADRAYLIGSHPHGILCFGAFCAFATDALQDQMQENFPGLETTLLTLPEQFRLPGSRELVASAGICSSSKKSMELLLEEREKGHATVLVVGGASEALNYETDEIRLVLNRRKGFVKLALRFGRDLVPCFSFGENFVYGQAPNPEGSRLRRFQDWFERNLSFSPPIVYGRGVFQYNYGIVPHRKPITVVVGAPIPVERVEQPSSEQILQLHAKYVQALKDLYQEYNPKYGDSNVRLNVA